MTATATPAATLPETKPLPTKVLSLCSSLFIYGGMVRPGLMSAYISRIPGCSVAGYDGLEITSKKTGAKLLFRLQRIGYTDADRDDNQIYAWVYEPVEAGGPVTKVMIFND